MYNVKSGLPVPLWSLGEKKQSKDNMILADIKYCILNVWRFECKCPDRHGLYTSVMTFLLVYFMFRLSLFKVRKESDMWSYYSG